MKDFALEQSEKELRERIEARTRLMQWRPNYKRWVEERVWQERYTEPVLQNLRDYIADLKLATILDLGSGMGGLIVRLQQEGLNAVGLDYCFDYCAIARLRGTRYGIQTQVINAQGEVIPLKDNSVDVILCYEVIEHVFDPVALLREMRRVVRSNGAIFITVPGRWSLYDHHYHLWGINILPRSVAEYIIQYTDREKDPDLGAGLQRLSEMHYFHFRSFVRLCNRLGFMVQDLREEKLRNGRSVIVSDFTWRLIGILRRSGLLSIVYKIYRSTIMDEFHLLLRRTAG